MRTRRRFVPLLIVLSLFAGLAARSQGPWIDQYREPASRIIEAALVDRFAWDRLAELTDTFGHRLSGSPQLEAAIRWAVEEMKNDGLENVRTEPVMVPRWVRGAESAEILEPAPDAIVMLGLGGSVGTGPDGVQAPVLVVRSFEELERKADFARGRIVVYNAPFTNYGETVQYRVEGASRAARHGAVAALVRSVGPVSLRTPHTGGMQYAPGVPQIPVAAITIEDADRLQRMQDRGARVVVRLKMEAHTLPDIESANVVAEITGREKPDEIVLLGGHFDSWDVGAGATDDGGGCIVTWDALRILKRLNLRPQRTLRVVLWTNEENGMRGALAYRDRHRDTLANHVLALESDSGVFRPLGFGFTGPDRARTTVTDIASLLKDLGADRIGPSGGGADIGPIVQAAQVPAMSLMVDGTRYFIVHHTPADTVDKIDPAEVSRCVAAVAVMVYIVADMPQRLGG